MLAGFYLLWKKFSMRITPNYSFESVSICHGGWILICNPNYSFESVSICPGGWILICNALRDWLPFVQFKKREKHPWRSVNFSKVACWKTAALLNVTLLHECFSRFLNCKNNTKSWNASHICSHVFRSCEQQIQISGCFYFYIWW